MRSRLASLMKLRRRANGFTLIELMIAIAILAIIMGIAIPSYNQWVLKSGRADAKAALFGAAQTLERCFTRFSAYNDGNCPLPNGATEMSENDKYQVTVASAPTTFTLTAAPQGTQANDTECTSFTLTHTGQKGANGGTADADIEKCW